MMYKYLMMCFIFIDVNAKLLFQPNNNNKHVDFIQSIDVHANLLSLSS